MSGPVVLEERKDMSAWTSASIKPTVMVDAHLSSTKIYLCAQKRVELKDGGQL